MKVVKKYGEEAKIAIRNVRREAMDEYRAMQKNSEITEDDLKVTEKDIQELTDKFISKIEDILKQKENEIMEV